MAWYGPWIRLKYAYDRFKNDSGKPELAFYLGKQNMNLNKNFHFSSKNNNLGYYTTIRKWLLNSIGY